ncbi:bifunctional SulP family inorganic anion transporter/carbonic anhydrase [Tundrisphaera sp. TA3]|uniref:bifunctional SulP family inorganic anion transporter/carbonic anhydrase n=1 Tax=Tundrisphaera sp. TA3 TaxID=3435775 RepID=UPI003EB99FB1
MSSIAGHPPATIFKDLKAGLVVFLVALPLCLGMSLASEAPLLSGVITGIIGGILVGMLSGTATAVSGPAAGLSTVVAAQILSLGSFRVFLMAVVVAGLIQIALGLARAGALASFIPTGVVRGIVTAIGVLLIIQQFPHVLGHVLDPEWSGVLLETNKAPILTRIQETFVGIHPGAALVGVVSLTLMAAWSLWPPLKRTGIPAPVVAVLAGTGISQLLNQIGGAWAIDAARRVNLPVSETILGYAHHLHHPDFSHWASPAVYVSALTIAAVASLEALLNLEAHDRIDPERRASPRNRELLAQGAGNVACGLLGGIPITLVIARSSVNITAGAKTRLATIFQGVLLLVSMVLLPRFLDLIPMSSLAAILLATGVSLIGHARVGRIRKEGPEQFIPFVVTVAASVLFDIMGGILIGLAVSIGYILRSSVRRPMRKIIEGHLGGEVVRIQLADQVSFLNRGALVRAFDEMPRGGHLLLDATSTDYIDPDVLQLIRDFSEQTAPARGVEVSLVGFREKYKMEDRTQYVDYSTREIQAALTPAKVLKILKDGHERFRTGRRLTRNLGRQVLATAAGQHPLAIVLSCMDSRSPAELIFDLGVGDIFVVRVAGNVTSRKILGSVEYGVAVAGAKLIVLMGHTRCGAVTGAVKLIHETRSIAEATGCDHLEPVVTEIQKAMADDSAKDFDRMTEAEQKAYVDDVARRNVVRSVSVMLQQSGTIARLVQEGKIAIVGALYDVSSGDIEYLTVEGQA